MQDLIWFWPLLSEIRWELAISLIIVASYISPSCQESDIICACNDCRHTHSPPLHFLSNIVMMAMSPMLSPRKSVDECLFNHVSHLLANKVFKTSLLVIWNVCKHLMTSIGLVLVYRNGWRRWRALKQPALLEEICGQNFQNSRWEFDLQTTSPLEKAFVPQV